MRKKYFPHNYSKENSRIFFTFLIEKSKTEMISISHDRPFNLLRTYLLRTYYNSFQNKMTNQTK